MDSILFKKIDYLSENLNNYLKKDFEGDIAPKEVIQRIDDLSVLFSEINKGLEVCERNFAVKISIEGFLNKSIYPCDNSYGCFTNFKLLMFFLGFCEDLGNVEFGTIPTNKKSIVLDAKSSYLRRECNKEIEIQIDTFLSIIENVFDFKLLKEIGVIDY